MSAPRKLASGSWSDGVDRTRPLQYAAFYVRNPDRIYVIKLQEQWHPCKGRKLLTKNGFRTHAEAIAYADKVARHART